MSGPIYTGFACI